MATDLLKNIRTRIERAGRIGNFPDEYVLELMGFKQRWSTDVIIDISDPKSPAGTRTESIKLVRVWHRRPDNKWIFGGGFRIHPDVTLAQMESHAIEMSMKDWIFGIPHGGSKGGAAFNPQAFSERDLIAIVVKITEAAVEAGVIGPYIDRWAPDVNTNETTMKWIQDHFAYEMQKARHPEPAAAVTGKPELFGGMPGRKEATGRGLHYALQTFLREYRPNLLLKKPTVAIQGFGNVGMHFALLAKEFNLQVVAVLDAFGGFYHPSIDVSKLCAYVARHPKRSVEGYDTEVKGDRIQSMEELVAVKADIVLPAALEDAITPKIAGMVPVETVVLEGANGPTAPESDAILEQNGILVIPDIYANAGGVTVSYFEWAWETDIQPFDPQLQLPSTKDAGLVAASLQNAFSRNGKNIIQLRRTLQKEPESRVSHRLASYIYAMERALPFFAMKRRKPNWLQDRKPLIGNGWA